MPWCLPNVTVRPAVPAARQRVPVGCAPDPRVVPSAGPAVERWGGRDGGSVDQSHLRRGQGERRQAGGETGVATDGGLAGVCGRG